MPLTNLHLIIDPVAYNAVRDEEIKTSENNLLRSTKTKGLAVDFDRKETGNLAIGYGLDLRVNSITKIADWYAQAGLSLSEEEKGFIIVYQSNPTAQSAQAVIRNLRALPDETAATRLLDAVVQDFEVGFNARFGVMPDSKERAALVSLVYHRGINNSALDPLIYAVQNDLRAEAWFQIRYNQNPLENAIDPTKGANGIANRRYRESDLFGLYSNQPLTEIEARNVLKVAARHQFDIVPYEAKFHPVGGVSISQALSPAVGVLITYYGAGQSLQQAFVAFSLGGDPIQGADSNDLLLGDTGHDILIGGGGDDVLRGEAGKDLYVINSGDGNDTIVDTPADLNGDGQPDGDGQGLVVFGQHLLQGGVKKQNESIYKSLDGQLTYQRSGSDLTVSGGGQTLTIKAWQEGQFGIRLTDAPSSFETEPALPQADRTDYRRIDHYVQVGNNPDGTPILEPVYAPFFDDNGNNTTQAGGLTQPMGAENDFVQAGGGNDTVLSFGGADQLFGDGGDDVLIAGLGQDFLHGGLGNDELQGGEHADYLYGEGDNDNLIGDEGDDRLEGGDGNDTLQGERTSQPLMAGGRDVLDGGMGHDSLVGGGGDDILLGGDGDDYLWSDDSTFSVALAPYGNDWLDGGDGVDNMQGGSGNDVLIGGTGDDKLWGDGPNNPALIWDPSADGRDTLDGGAGDDELQGGGNDDILVGGLDNDRLFGDSSVPNGVIGNDVLDGGDGADYLEGMGGNDILYGGTGGDTLWGDDPRVGGTGDDFLDGGDGNDFLIGQQGDDVLLGGSGDDRLDGTVSTDVNTVDADRLAGEGGDDELYGGGGVDTLSGGEGDDVLASDDIVDFALDGSRFAVVTSAPADEVLDGGAGNDKIYGGGGADILSGGDGDDFLLGDDLIAKFTVPGPNSNPFFNPNFDPFHVSNISLSFNPGNDVLDGGNGNDYIFGRGGDDRLLGGTDNDFLDGGIGNDFLDGGDADDFLVGGEGVNTLLGGAGHDTLHGGTGNDSLDGGEGDDILVGGAGTDTLLGGSGNDRLTGSGNGLLDGGAGNDELIGGTGDSFVFDAGYGFDTAQTMGGGTLRLGPGVSTSTVTIRRGTSTTVSGTGPDLLVGINGTSDLLVFQNYFTLSSAQAPRLQFADGTIWTADTVKDRVLISTGETNTQQGFNDRNDVIQGSQQNEIQTAFAGNDTLSGGGGRDVLFGGGGSDVYRFGAGFGNNTFFDRRGTADVVSFASGIIPTNVTVLRSGSDLVLTTDTAGDQITVSGFFADSRVQIEQVQFADGTAWDAATLQRLPSGIVGTNQVDILLGTATADSLFGLGGNDTLNGGAEADRLVGGAGDDTYVVDALGDIVVEAFDEGIDTVQSSVTSALDANVENLTLTGTAALDGTGNALANVLTGNSGANVLTGGAGNDIYVIGVGDTVVEQVNEGTDRVQTDQSYTLGANLENLTLTGAAAIDGTGNALDNVLTGNSAANVLTGLAGNDTYVIGAGDTIVELANEGIDTIKTDQGYSLGANVENLTLTGTGNVSGTGNDSDNVLTGNSGANVLTGGAGNDTYVIGAGDTVVEQTNEGIDTVITNQGITLGANLENLTLTGTANLNGTGNAGANTVLGNDGKNMLDGGAGIDVLVGGKSDDTYLVDEAGDVVTEAADEGLDTVQSVVSRSLGANIENLTLTGTAAINGTGNALDNILTGNSAVNLLSGGAGNDTYVVSTGDTVVELANEGIDTVITDQTYELGVGVEHLTLTGTAAIDGTGNSSDNTLTGNSAANVLMGRAGNDTYLFGRNSGADTIVDVDATVGIFDTVQFADDVRPSDIVAARSGDNLILSITGTSAQLTVQSFFLGVANQVEQFLFADGTFWDVAAVTERLPKMLTGTAGQDTLYGGGGADTFDGGAHNDRLYGYDGNDAYLFGIGAGQDIVLDFDSAIGNADTIQLGAGIVPAGLSFSRVDKDLVIKILGTTDQLTIQSFYADSAYSIERLRFADGTVWDAETIKDQGRQVLQGTSGNDLVGPVNAVATNPHQWIFGGAGDDRLSGDAGDLIGKFTVAGDDKVFGEDGHDQLYGGGQNDILDGGTGNDRLLGDTFLNGFQEFASFLPGDDILRGGVGDDTLLGEAGNDVLEGGADQDSLTGDVGDDALDGGAGQDVLQGGDGDDQLMGGLGDDNLTGGNGDDLLDGGAGNDSLAGGEGNDRFVFGRGYGQDTIGGFGPDGDFSTTSVNVVVMGADVLPDDVLVGRAVDPTRSELGHGDLTLGISGTTDQLLVRGFFTSRTIQQVEFSDGTIWDEQTIKEMTLSLAGTIGNDVLIGSDLDEVISGSDGDDTLDGKAGSDVLTGGLGNDTYTVDSMFDTIVEENGAGIDTVRSSVDYALGDSLEHLTLVDPGGSLVNLGSRVFGPDPERTAVIASGNAVNNVLTGNGGDNLLDGGAGDDTLFGGDGSTRFPVTGGDDILIGGLGNDTYRYNPGGGVDTILDQATPGEGNRLVFGRGARNEQVNAVTLDVVAGQLRLRTGFGSSGGVAPDTILFPNFDPNDPYGRHAVETFEFSNGTMRTYSQLIDQGFDYLGTESNDSLQGTALGDRFSGEAGDDALYGAGGNDAYAFNLGSGVDTIIDVALAGAGNAIEFGFGIGLGDLDFVHTGSMLTIAVGATGDAIRLAGFDAQGVNGSFVTEQLRFADGSQMSLGTVFGGAATDAGDVLSGGLGDDVLFGKGGDDTITGGGGNDTLLGGVGADALSGEGGNDVLSGGAGQDTYHFHVGDGQDTIKDVARPGEGNRLVLGPGFDGATIRLQRPSNLFNVLALSNGSDEVRLGNFDSNDPYGMHAVETFLFFDGSTLSYQQLIDRGLDVLGTETSEFVQGTDLTNDRLVGFGGSDFLLGQGGEDVLLGGLGDDSLQGGAGSDTYVFNIGDGSDFISDVAGSGETNRLIFGTGITLADISVIHNPFNIQLNIGSNGDAVRFQNFAFGIPDVQVIEFADGSQTTLAALLTPIDGTAGPDSLIGRGTSDMMRGFGGADFIRGGTGDDTIEGGIGNDDLRGEAGSDTYRFNLGDGIDIITDRAVVGEGNRILFGAGITPSDVTVAYNTDAPSTITVGGSGDQILLGGFGSPAIPNQSLVVDTLEFSDGSQRALTSFFQATVATTLNDGLVGGQLNDTLDGLAGDDILDGAGGDDTLLGGAGLDYLIGGSGDDTLDGGIGVDAMQGGGGNDTYLLDDPNDVVFEAAGEGVDTVRRVGGITLSANVENLELLGTLGSSGLGNELNNQLIGNSGDNRLDGGLGSDTLIGGQGNDIYVVNPEEDVIVEALNEGIDTVESSAERVVLGDHLENLTLTSGALIGVGNELNNIIVGTGANNLLDGGAGVDQLTGGAGDDIYIVDDTADVVTEQAFGGTDWVESSVSFVLGDHFENLELTGTLAINGAGNEVVNTIIGNSAANILNGGGGNDTLSGGADSDVLRGGTGHDLYFFNLGDGIDTIDDVTTVDEGNVLYFGAGITRANLSASLNQTTVQVNVGSGGDALRFLNFDPTGVNGSLAVQTLQFADGSTISLLDLLNTPLNQAPTVAVPLADQTVSEDAPFSLVVPADTFVDADAGDVLTLSASLADGSTLPAWLTFNAATGTFTGTPDDAQVVTLDLRVTATDTGTLSVSDDFTVTVTNVNEAPMVAVPLTDQQATEDAPFIFVVQTSTFADVDQLHGDQLTYSATREDGTALPSWLSFDATTRTFSGTPLNSDVGTLALRVTATDIGNLNASDTFSLTVTNVNDAPTVAALIADQKGNEDETFSFTIAADTFADHDLMHGDLLSYGATLADGSPLPTWLSFSSTTRTLSGTPGAGDAGTLQIAVTATDSGMLSATDTVALVIAGPLPKTLVGTAGNDVLIGGRGDDTLIGLAGNDTLTGGEGQDLLDGGTGNDTMQGGTGNDTYIVDVAGDVVTELANEGTDTVQSSITYTLGANVENLTLTGTANLNGTGNALDNVLTGNSGINVLTGGAGNDTYLVSAGDTVVENFNSGTDTVVSAATWTLGSNLENLTLTGTANLNGTGNVNNNLLIGNSGNNALDGGAGNDTVDGGDGNDSLVGGSGDDQLLGGLGADVLNAGSGHDGLNGGDGTDTLDGGAGDDQLLGGAGNDTMIGGSGADQFTGGTGNDTMTGGSGNDRYHFARGDGQDTIIDSDPFPGNQDRAVFGATINPLDLVISRQVNDLRLTIHGSSDQITVQNWYLGNNSRIETIQAGNGQTLLSTQVDQLIQAMAGFTQQSGLTWDQAIDQQPQQVQTVLAASWQ